MTDLTDAERAMLSEGEREHLAMAQRHEWQRAYPPDDPLVDALRDLARTRLALQRAEAERDQAHRDRRAYGSSVNELSDTIETQRGTIGCVEQERDALRAQVATLCAAAIDRSMSGQRWCAICDEPADAHLPDCPVGHALAATATPPQQPTQPEEDFSYRHGL